jgi:hypothetical protein
MDEPREMAILVEYLVRTSRLNPSEASRLVDEVVAFLNETAEEFVRRRHGELQQAGLSNREIFSRIRVAATRRRFRAADYTERQIRRIVYG